MEKKLKNILEFLKLHKQYNEALQIRFALNTININESSFNQLISLLYTTINTQSQPKIDKTAAFFKRIYTNSFEINTFDDFFKFIVGKSIENYGKSDIYNQLFKSMINQDGWGPKTSALLIKNIYNYHYRFHPSYGLNFWNDVPSLSENDKLSLPVDTVILAIFNDKLSLNKKMYFNSINKIIKQEFSNEDMILFDDLWFWGFITQKIENKQRTHRWNEEKYWALEESSKDEKTIDEIEVIAKSFLSILEESNV